LADNFVTSKSGTVSVNIDEGRIRFESSKGGNCFWLKLAKPGEEVAREIEDLMVHTPGK
jgi:hypothetical protein